MGKIKTELHLDGASIIHTTIYCMVMVKPCSQASISLVPRPLPDFISQPWRRRPGIKTISRTGNGGLG